MIPDFDDRELDTIKDLLQDRFKEAVETHLADTELKLDPGSTELTQCPAVFWQARDCNFVLFKTGPLEYCCQFFYDPNEQFGTGHDRYHDIGECVATLLQVQSDHERDREGVSSGSTGEQLPN